MHCVVSLSKTLYPMVSTGSTQEGPSRYELKILDWDVNDQNKRKQMNMHNLDQIKGGGNVETMFI